LNIAEGHKTGFYLDQRDSRFRFYQHTLFRKFQNVLNCYCYTGGFTVAALAGGAAHVTSIDSSGLRLRKPRPMCCSMGLMCHARLSWMPM